MVKATGYYSLSFLLPHLRAETPGVGTYVFVRVLPFEFLILIGIEFYRLTPNTKEAFLSRGCSLIFDMYIRSVSSYSRRCIVSVVIFLTFE